MKDGEMKSLGLISELYARMMADLDLPTKDVTTIVSRLRHEGLTFATKRLPALSKALLDGLETGTFKLPDGFKNRRLTHKNARGSYKETVLLPVFLGSAWSLVFENNGSLKSDPSDTAIRTIRQVCDYVYKLDLPYKEVESTTVVNSFVSTELEVAQLQFEADDQLLLIANYVTRDAFGCFTPDSIVCGHGPGATSNCQLGEKDESQLSPNLGVYSLYGDRFFFNAEDGMSRLNRYPVSNTFSYFTSSVNARVVLVPKDSRGPRLISAEPVEHQFVQQGISRWLVERIETYPLSSGHVNFTNQTVNQELAKRASISREYCTLDLKDASDRNSLSLFNCVFGSATELQQSILLARTSSTMLPSGRILPLAKFAPMGSALCFPVMSWTIFVLLYSGFMLAGEGDQIYKHIFVYGDDIIVPNRLRELAVSILERYGFAVNIQKSYSNGFFRESCGGDFFKGTNVVPKRLRQLGVSTDDPKTRAFRLLTHGNEMSHFPAVQKYCWDAAEGILGELPFSSTAAPYLFKLVETRTEAHSRNRLVKRPNFWTLKSEVRSYKTSEYGHFTRVWRGLGASESDLLPGVFEVPRRWKLVRVRRRLSVFDYL